MPVPADEPRIIRSPSLHPSRLPLAERIAEYEICQRRGHECDGSGEKVLTGAYTDYSCKWCGTYYRVHRPGPPRVEELNPPTKGDS
jgi:hypothetical protein